MSLKWSTEKPTVEGDYVFVKRGEWPLRIVRVCMGRWQLTQDPERLYANDVVLESDALQGRWLGPLPRWDV